MFRVFPLDKASYKDISLIGRGTTSEVWHAQRTDNGCDVSIKKIDLEMFPMDLDILHREVLHWSKAQHKNIVAYHGSFIDGSVLHIVMEYMSGGSISELIKFKCPEGFSDEKVIATILRNVLEALDSIHRSGAVHRDIKAANILIHGDGTIKICDFGFAAGLLSGIGKVARYTVIGTPCYMAPEIFSETRGYTEKADIWSLAITAIELATGKAPYADEDPLDVVEHIMNDPPPTLPKERPFSKEFRSFVQECLQFRPTRRPSAKELLEHPFIAKSEPNFLAKILNGLPSLEERFLKLDRDRIDNIVEQATQTTSPEWSFENSCNVMGIVGSLPVLKSRFRVTRVKKNNDMAISENTVKELIQRICSLEQENLELKRRLKSC